MELLGLKLILIPTLIAFATLAERRWGAGVGGWVSGLPLTSGPVSIFLAVERGPSFAVEAAGATILGLVAVASFAVAYACVARFAGLPASVIAGFVAYLGAGLTLSTIESQPWSAFLTAFGSLVAALAIAPRSTENLAAIAHARWDVPVRALVATAMVVMITGSAELLGPTGSGLLSPFPVFACVMTAFAHARGGRDRAVCVLRGVLLGSFAFAVFFLVIAMTLGDPIIAQAYLGAATAAALVQYTACTLTSKRWRQHHVPA